MAAVKHIFIINPAAGKCDRTNQVAASIRAAAMELGVDYEILTTEYPRHAVSQVRQKAEEYPDRPLRFYACGGDGTLNEVAAGAAGLPNVAITHYPTGSGNDFIKLFGADCRAFSDLKSLICGKELELDYMETDRGISLNVFSVGVDARIADGMQKYKRIPALQGKTAYNISTVENLLRGLSEPYEILVDGQRFDVLTTEGGSTFEIPVRALDTPLTVIGDTTAMSTPHEIEYTLTFKSATAVEAAQ